MQFRLVTVWIITPNSPGNPELDIVHSNSIQTYIANIYPTTILTMSYGRGKSQLCGDCTISCLLLFIGININNNGKFILSNGVKHNSCFSFPQKTQLHSRIKEFGLYSSFLEKVRSQLEMAGCEYDRKMMNSVLVDSRIDFVLCITRNGWKRNA